MRVKNNLRDGTELLTHIMNNMKPYHCITIKFDDKLLMAMNIKIERPNNTEDLIIMLEDIIAGLKTPLVEDTILF